MTEQRFDVQLLDKRVFAVVFAFSLASGIMGVQSYLSFFIHRQLTTADFGAVSLLFYVVGFLINPLLFFIVLYLYCGGQLLNRMARVLISIILGSLLGFWVGNLAVAGVATVLYTPEEAAANFFFLSQLIPYLPTMVISQLLEAFAVLAFSDLVPKWRNALPVELQGEKVPLGIVLLAVVYVIFALINALAVPIIALWSALWATTAISIWLIATLAAVGLLVLGQIVLAIGLYRGRKWAWVLSVVSAGSTLLIDITVFGVLLALGTESTTGALLLLGGLFFGSLISFVIFAYLLRANVRKFFGLVNATRSTSGQV